MEDDPWEQRDLSAEAADVVAELDRKRMRWADTFRGPMEDPLHRIAREGPTGYQWFEAEFTGV
jgi:hypothetical protein